MNAIQKQGDAAAHAASQTIRLRTQGTPPERQAGIMQIHT
jgi:hypothetical protein